MRQTRREILRFGMAAAGGLVTVAPGRQMSSHALFGQLVDTSRDEKKTSRISWTLTEQRRARYSFSVARLGAGTRSEQEELGELAVDGAIKLAVRASFDEFFAAAYLPQREWLDVTARLGTRLWDALPTWFHDYYWRDVHGRNIDSIIIRSDERVIPWELLMPENPKSGESAPMIGLAYDIARWNGISGSIHVVEPKITLVAPDLSTLPLAQQDEVAELERTIGGDHLIPGNSTQMLSLLQQRGPTVVHVATHGAFDRIRLADRVLVPDDIIRFSDGKVVRPVFVFLNVCEAGQPNWNAPFLQAGWTDVLSEVGCSGVVAPSWRVVGQVAREAASQFYASVAEGRTLSQAVLDVRRRAISDQTDRRLRGHPSWLAYAAHCHPDVTIGLSAHNVA